MKNYDRESLKVIFKNNICPILIQNIDCDAFNNYVVLDKDSDSSLFNGHYEGINFVGPKWYYELEEKSKNEYCILILKDINMLDFDSQLRFMEILKYRKISTFELPSNCRIILLCDNLEKSPLCEEIYSLVAQV